MIAVGGFFPAAKQVLRLNGLFTDNLILQRNVPDPIFGTAAAGSTVTITQGQRTFLTKADSSGNWKIALPGGDIGPAFNLDVTSGGTTVTLHNVKMGEVWLASGQSNMEFTESGADDYDQAKTETSPDIRFFTVKTATAEIPLNTVEGSWIPSSPNTIGRFSAVALSFAREISNRLGCPVGIISSSWGGTPAEAWESREKLEKDPLTKPIIDKFNSDIAVYPARKAAYDVAMQMWIDGRKGGSNSGFQNGWNLNVFNDSDWQTVPGGADTRAILKRDFEGSVWYRKAITIPDEWYGQSLRLSLGTLSDFDTTYFNGVRVGLTDEATLNPEQLERNYSIAPGLVHKGTNLIAIRVFNANGDGGMRGPSDDMKIALMDDTASQPLNGEWKFKIEQELDPDTPRPHLPNGPGNPTSPAELFNAMISPLIPFRIKGVIWYQGEANVGSSSTYAPLFTDLIQDWRSRWGEGPFPFYFVQLPNYQQRKTDPGNSSWANLREAQSKALSVPETGMAVTIDLGEADNIHPKAKREVGRRLSYWALQRTYELPTVYASPSFKSMNVAGSRVEITFSNGSLITTDGRPPTGFQIAGADQKYYWADAMLDGSTVTVSSPQVPHPVAVRYAWADNPAVNLVNRSGFPAAPFRTDTWQLAEDVK